MPRYLLSCEFDGRAWAGTQSQDNARALQDEIDRALAGLSDGAAGRIRFASRLDAGVSALDLPGHVDLPRTWDPSALCLALTQRLPDDVAVRRAAPVAEGFHAQHAAAAKTYRYRILVRGVRPVLDRQVWWLRRLDRPDLLPGLASQLIGARDLSGFATLRHDGTDEDDPVRTVLDAGWTSAATAQGLELTFRIHATGFLYRQVRGLVGAMAQVARGTVDPGLFAAAIAAGRGAPRIGNIAPAEGLCLESVAYDPPPAWVEAVPAGH